MDQITLSLGNAKRLIAHTQLTGFHSSKADEHADIAGIIAHLGYVQIDTINVINRAHQHTLWTRIPGYTLHDVYATQAKEKTIFEYWGHAMSYLPMRDYRYFLPQKKKFIDPYSKWEKDRLEKYGHLMTPVLERIREEGAMSSKDFASEEKPHKGTWWDWRPTKVALEMLFWQGKIMVAERKNFQKVFDLTERVLPDDVDTSMPSEEELGRFLVERALKAYGLADKKEIVDHLRVAKKKLILSALQEMLSDGSVVRVKVKHEDGDDHLEYYALPGTIEEMDDLSGTDPQVFILSPFDNFCIQRDRLKTFFDFDYALECYLPKEKRVFGYFTLPIFWQDGFAGRMDAKADRKNKELIIHHLKFEDTFRIDDAFLAELQKKLISFMKFQGCERIHLTKVTPDGVELALPG